MKSSTTYLHFDGNCREAMTFYRDCFGGELHTSPYPDPQGNPSADPAAKLMHSQVTKNGQTVVQASDSAPGGVSKPGDNFSVSIDCESAEEIDQLFNALGHRGQVRLPLSDVPWGAQFGMLTDCFGIQWMFNFQKGN